ncbi:MAG: hypothetical protein ACE5F6_16290 [Anaerolineae bacterium]
MRGVCRRRRFRSYTAWLDGFPQRRRPVLDASWRERGPAVDGRWVRAGGGGGVRGCLLRRRGFAQPPGRITPAAPDRAVWGRTGRRWGEPRSRWWRPAWPDPPA